MPVERILILGGTGSARQAADALVLRKAHVVMSLAGVTQNPQVSKCEIRKGGFGGTQGLKAYLRSHKFDLVVDATHSFAVQMAEHAALACAEAAVRLLRLEPPPWVAQASDHWRSKASVAAAVAATPRKARVALTLGHKGIGAFFARSDLSGIARMIEPLGMKVPQGWKISLQRPPFTLNAEMEWLGSNHIEILVSKNAGGVRVAKLDAAAALGVSVIMLARPIKPVVDTVSTVPELLGRLGLKL